MNFNDIIKDLQEGNDRFIKGESRLNSQSSIEKLISSANKNQVPKAIILSCSDSRTPAEMILDQDIGDLFVIRVAGNIIAPSLIGSVEFAACTFSTKLVLVLGHTNCGAIKATLDHINNAHILHSENINDIVSRIKPNIFHISQMQINDEEKVQYATEANILASVNQLSHSSKLIENLVSENKIKIVGSVLDLSTGKIKFLDL
jgi:carbonic anhydrase